MLKGGELEEGAGKEEKDGETETVNRHMRSGLSGPRMEPWN